MADDEVVGQTTDEPELALPPADAAACPGCCAAEGGSPCCYQAEGDSPAGAAPAEEAPRSAPEPEAAGEDTWPATGVRVVGLRFRPGGKIYYFQPGDFPLAVGDFVVVETERGPDVGEVTSLQARLEPGEEQPTKRLLRPAGPADVRRKRALENKQVQAFKTCERKIAEHKLDMKLLEAAYTLDGKRLTFSFVAEGRVDFRDLVRDLAQTFRCRIELRQVGVRDQARLIGGLGPCGRPLCCATFLKDFCSVGIRLAKDQGLSLNPGKISGACDRLMCCLRYEHAQYVELNRRLPKVGERVECGAVAGEVLERNLLTASVRIRTDDGREVVLTEKELFPEGLKVPLPGARPERRREERRPRERKPRRREERPGGAPPAEPAPGEAAAPEAAGAETPAPPPTSEGEAKPPEDHRKHGHRHRGPRHRRRRKPGAAPAGTPEGKKPTGRGDQPGS